MFRVLALKNVYTYTTNQQINFYQYVQSHIINLHQIGSVTPVNITGCLTKRIQSI